MDNVELLRAKDAIFRLIGQYCGCFLGTDDNYYMSDYFDCVLERSFDVLGFDRDEVPLVDFCQAWEDNNRKLWAINFPDEEYKGSTARDYYNIFVKSYKRWADSNFEDAEVVPVVHGRWVEYQIPPIICCSNCDWATGTEEKNFQYCPNCGAKMDGSKA